MQKKIIALAVAGLVSGAAFAQTNVTVYGIADVGYQYSTDSYIDGQKSKSEIADGGQDGSRVGFKGTEDLGNGLSAFFQLETRFHLDTASNIEGRNSNVGLSGKSWGTVKLGSFGSLLDDYNGYSEAGGMGYGNGVIDQIGYDDIHNGIEYISPNFSGLEFKAAYSTSVANEDPAIQFDGAGNTAFAAVKAYSVSGAYANGPIKASLVYSHQKPANQADGQNEKVNEWLINGSYNFGPVMVGAGYDQQKADFDGEWAKRKAWRINVGAPVTANDTVALSYSRVKYNWSDDDLSSGKASGWGVSYSHAMSKRTNIYATYGKLSQNDVLETVDSQAFGDSYESAFKVGMRHFF